VAVISGLSLVGVVGLVMSREALRAILFFAVAFAAGALLGDAFFHLVPEIAESGPGFDSFASMALLSGITAFFVLEKIVHWHHAHFPGEEVLHPVVITNLVGDGLHNFIDGAIVAGSFAVSAQLGVATSIAVALHEIPQEIGDFAILIHAGLEPKRALFLNFMSALTAIAGALLVLLFASVGMLERFVVPFSAGAFIYIASTDLLPDLHKEAQPAKSALQLIALIAGGGVMALLLLVE
jgi:zinc and cadmium transporter